MASIPDDMNQNVVNSKTYPYQQEAVTSPSNSPPSNIVNNETRLKHPSTEELIPALKALKLRRPNIRPSQMKKYFREENQWQVTKRRLMRAKRELRNIAVGGEPPAVEEPRIPYPANALAAQQQYKDESARCFKLYSRGPYDFGVSPLSDMATKIEIAHNRLVETGRPTTAEHQKAMAEGLPMQCLWEYYWAAAQKVGISNADIGRQLEAEYGVNPIPYLRSPSRAQVDARKAAFKEESMKLKRQMLSFSEARQYIPVDKNGEPTWREEVNGEFALVMVKIDKQKGSEEFGFV